MNDIALRQFIEMVFLSTIPVAVGGVIIIILFLLVIHNIDQLLPDKDILDEKQNP